MNIDECMKIKHHKYNECNIDNKKLIYLKSLVTRILISIIFLLSIGISIKLEHNNSSYIYEYLFQDSLEFTKINNWYQSNIGKIIPDIKSNTNLVFSNQDIFKNEYEKYLDGIKLNVSKNTPISIINGGIVVFIGEKDDYGNTLILQGNDGIDYWYGNITNVNVNLYDYLEKDTLIGETKEDYLYLVLKRDGKYLNYEEYIKQNND